MVGGEEIGLGAGEHWERRRDAKGVSGGYEAERREVAKTSGVERKVGRKQRGKQRSR